MSETETNTTPVNEAEPGNTPETKQEPKQETFLEGAWDFLKTLIISMIIVFGITNFIARPIQVVGRSMYPTLQPDAVGLANIFGRKTNGLKRFDIAIIYVDSKKDYLVKRVIGLPGETVAYRNGTLYINEEAVEEPFFDAEYVAGYEGEFMQDVEPFTLGEQEYYCLGDNRPASKDSRYYGPFTDDQIVAKGALILYPFNQFGVRSW